LFALVSYLPDPLAGFLDRLRIELVPDTRPHSHVTILPPRPLHTEIEASIRLIEQKCGQAAPFTVELGDIEIFDCSSVVYLSIGRGERELKSLYTELNQGPLAYHEPFEYHPHITLTQYAGPGESVRLAAVARERWHAWRGPRSFTVETMSFVQHVVPQVWADVALAPLLAPAPVG